MTQSNKSSARVFKPLKTLTFWTLMLIIARLAGLALYWLCYIGMIVLDRVVDFDSAGDALTTDGLTIATSLAGLLYVATYLISGIVTLFWLYGTAGNAKIIRPSIDFTPGWAVGWYFVPIANLFKPYEVLRDIWIAGKGRINGVYPKGTPRLAVWWLCTIIGGVATSIAGRMGADMGMVPVILSAIGLPVLFISTATYFSLVREIHRDQLSSDTRIVDQF